MWNEKGMSLIDSLLTLAVVMVLLSFLPLVFQMKQTLYIKKLNLHASEVALEGLNIAISQGRSEGSSIIDEVDYHWIFDGETICVRFQILHEVRTKCVNKEGEYSTIQKDIP